MVSYEYLVATIIYLLDKFYNGKGRKKTELGTEKIWFKFKP